MPSAQGSFLCIMPPHRLCASVLEIQLYSSNFTTIPRIDDFVKLSDTKKAILTHRAYKPLFLLFKAVSHKAYLDSADPLITSATSLTVT